MTTESDSKRAFTKIVATIGPASEEHLGALIEAGLNVARINFSHGEEADHRRRVARVRAEAEARGRQVGILADIQGPKLRMGLFEGGERELERGERYRLGEGDGLAAADQILFNFEGLLAGVEPGQRLFLADGVVEMLVERGAGDELAGRVLRGGRIGDRKGVNLPETALEIELPTPKDRVDLKIACDLSVDFIGVSFVSGPEDLLRIRDLASGVGLVAKIERRAALENIDGILEEADGIMVARGDLGVEVELERLPLIQKDLIQAARRAGVFAITATEMLESMVHNPRPTRAEAGDVANAVLDGTDAVMLSAETAVGRYPVQAVATMRRIAEAVHESARYRELPHVAFRELERGFDNATAYAAVDAAQTLGVDKIVCFTESGNTARLLSRYRPAAEILALSGNPRSLGLMSVMAHVRPLAFQRPEALEDMFDAASRWLLELGLVERGEAVVFVAAVPPGVSHTTNAMKLHRIGEPMGPA